MSRNKDIRDAVEAELGFDPLVDAADITDVDFKVQDALDRWAVIPHDSDINVDTRGNTVTLTGHVRTWAEHDAVVDAAWMTSGVHDVDDELTVTGS